MLGTVTRAGDEAWASAQPHAGVKGWGEMPLLSCYSPAWGTQAGSPRGVWPASIPPAA